ncbi:MAG: hypothetical protein KTR32_00920 [Granulosicoccus sp.]|nr:hypothetical protein [Granulosicoccus sp.]
MFPVTRIGQVRTTTRKPVDTLAANPSQLPVNRTGSSTLGQSIDNLAQSFPARYLIAAKKTTAPKPPVSFSPPQVIDQPVTNAGSPNKPHSGETRYKTSMWQDQVRAHDTETELKVIESVEALLVNGKRGESVVNRQELQMLTNNPFVAAELKTAARYLLENPSALRTLETAGNRSGVNHLSGDDTISIGDVHARRLNLPRNIPEQAEPPDKTTGYQVPSENHTQVSGVLDTPNRPTSLYAKQQDTVEFAMRTGRAINFRNSEDALSTLKITQSRTGNNASYLVALTNTAGGVVQFDVRSSIGIAKTIEGIANIIEWGTTFNARRGIREFPTTVIFNRKAHVAGNIAATYHGKSHTMTFYEGDKTISELNYNHEMGHGIGWQLDDVGPGIMLFGRSSALADWQDFTPVDWESVVDTATAEGVDHATRYAGTSHAEDFAESLSAYMHARDNGSAAIRAFRITYPHRSAYIEKHILEENTRQDR